MTKSKPVDVEIFTDIALTGDGSGWAAVIIRGDRRGGIVEASGRMKHVPLNGNTDILEARAVANGLHKAKLERLIMPGERVLVRTDNNGVVQRWKAKREFRREAPDVEAALEVVRSIAAKLKCTVELKHVPSHQPAARIAAGDHLATMNARADFLARKALGAKAKGAGGVNEKNWPSVVARYRPSLLATVRDTVARLTGAA